MTTKRAEPKGSERKHELTPQEQAAIENYRARQAAIAPSLKFDKERARFSPDHPQEAVGFVLLMEALGTADLDFLNGLLRQLTNVSSPGEQIDEGGLNFMVSVVKGIQPRDQVEAMLAAQMAAVHRATMAFAQRLALVNDPTAAGQRGARLQQARPDVCKPDGGAQALPRGWRAEAHGAKCVGQRWGAGDRGQRDAGATRGRARRGCGVTARAR